MKDKGYIYLHRKILDSSVWKNPNTLAVWIWCLLKATHVKYKFPFNGTDIELEAGSFITGREIASKEAKISPQTYRTCINYLKSTNRITIKATNKFSIISIVNWEEYQNKPTNKSTSPLTNHQPTTNQQLTTYNNNNNNITIKRGAFAPPSISEVKSYCEERKNTVNAENFIDFYESKGWLIGKNKMKDWRAAVRTWENRDGQKGRTEEKAIIPAYAKGWAK